jgi:polysaccharide lyase family 4-like protein
VVIQAGSKVSFPNNDPIFHNFFSLSGPKTFDLGNYPKGDTRMVMFPDPGIVYVNCHLHPNMTGTIVVAPNRWNTQADREGRFALQDVPPGKYTIVAWHKAAGFFRQTVVVAEGRDENVEFLIPIDESGRAIESQKVAAKGRE